MIGSYLEEAEEFREEVVDLTADSILVCRCEIADAGNGRSEDFLLRGLFQTIFDVLPEIVHKAQIVWQEIGQRRHYIEPVAFNVVNALEIVDDQVVESRQPIDGQGKAPFAECDERDLSYGEESGRESVSALSVKVGNVREVGKHIVDVLVGDNLAARNGDQI